MGVDDAFLEIFELKRLVIPVCNGKGSEEYDSDDH